MICKSYGWSVKGTGDLETIGMICKSYGWSVKQYRRPGDDRNDLQKLWMVCKKIQVPWTR